MSRACSSDALLAFAKANNIASLCVSCLRFKEPEGPRDLIQSRPSYDYLVEFNLAVGLSNRQSSGDTKY